MVDAKTRAAVPELPVRVLDTKGFESGLVSPFGPPGRRLVMVLHSKRTLALDNRVEDEYRTALAWPKFGIEPLRQDALLAVL